jgi:hypothetical protein
MTTRSTAQQGTTVRLYINFKKNAQLKDPYDPGTVTLIDPNSVQQASGLTPIRESEGVFYIDYALSVNAAVGEWTDR